MNKKQIAIALGVMCMILTLTLVVQIRTTNNANQVVSQTFTSNDLRDQVLKWKERYDYTYSELQTAEKRLEEIRQEASENTEGSTENEAEQTKKKDRNAGCRIGEKVCRKDFAQDIPAEVGYITNQYHIKQRKRKFRRNIY